MDSFVLGRLERIVGKDNVTTDRQRMLSYLVDESPVAVRPAPASDLLLCRPENAVQISSILQIANARSIKVFPRGGGTGLAGGAIPTQDGIILSMERMNKIEIDEDNMMTIAEAGVTLGQLMAAADAANLSFPPHPGDENAEVGGLVATNAGGSRAVRHGVMRHHIRAIEAVLSTGEILSLGGRVHKNNVGYDLMQLIVGSEGTLAVITKVTLQLYPKSRVTMTMIVPYDERCDALSSVPEVLRGADTPLAIEYVERDLMEKSAKHLGARWPVTVGKCRLIIIADEPSEDQVMIECQKIAAICSRRTTYEPYAAKSKSDQDNILTIRSNIYLALKKDTMDILDVTVPIATLEKVISSIQEIANKRAAPLALFGHAGDGNLHVHIMRKETQTLEDVEILRNSVYEIARNAGGVITGEHGVGKIRIKKVEQCFTEKELQLMKSIKSMFDPKGILNPGTKIPA